MATTTWDPSNKSSSLTLSGGNLTVTATAAHSANLVRATNSQSSGKYYMECTFSTVPGAGDEGIGLVTAATSMSTTTAWLGHDGNPSTSFGNYNGLVYLNGGNFVTSFPPMSAGTTFGMAVDFTHGKIWWWNPTASGQTGGEWNGDVLANQNPATNTGGVDFVTAHPLTGFGSGTAFYPAVDLEDNTAVITANFGATAYAIASTALASSISGFLNWDGSSSGGGGGIVAPPPHPLPKLLMKRRKFIQGHRFQRKAISLIKPVTRPIKPTRLKPWKRRVSFRQHFRPRDRFPVMYVTGAITPTLIVTKPWHVGVGPLAGGPYGSAGYATIFLLQPQVPAAEPQKRNPRRTAFRPRKLFSQRFFPKHWAPIHLGGPIPHPPIAAGLTKKFPRPKMRRNKWKAIAKRWPNNPFVIDIFRTAQIGWMYGSGPMGGPYGSAGQLYTLPALPYPSDGSSFGSTYYGLGAIPYGAAPYGAAAQVLGAFNSQDHIPGTQPSRVAPAGAIRVTAPYIAATRVSKPSLAQTRKAPQSLQQLRTNTPKLTK